MAVPVLFSIQGCTDQEVLGTIAGAAIVGGAVAVGVAASKDHEGVMITVATAAIAVLTTVLRQPELQSTAT